MPKALHPYNIIQRPLITEKATILAAEHKYAFAVNPRANKTQIRDAIQMAFSVRVRSVHTMNMRGKRRRFGTRVRQSPDWKKAIVTLHEGDSIQIFEGI